MIKELSLKKCASCKIEKSRDLFGGDKTRKDSKNPYCKDCIYVLQNKYRKKYPSKYIESNRRSKLKKHGLTADKWDELLFIQNGVCPIQGCGSAERLSVDHDHSCCPGQHSCGKCIRGIICDNCNNALGRVNDSVIKLNGLIRYLERKM